MTNFYVIWYIYKQLYKNSFFICACRTRSSGLMQWELETLINISVVKCKISSGYEGLFYSSDLKLNLNHLSERAALTVYCISLSFDFIWLFPVWLIAFICVLFPQVPQESPAEDHQAGHWPGGRLIMPPLVSASHFLFTLLYLYSSLSSALFKPLSSGIKGLVIYPKLLLHTHSTAPLNDGKVSK